MPAAAESELSTSGLMLELASRFLLHSGSGLVIRVFIVPPKLFIKRRHGPLKALRLADDCE